MSGTITQIILASASAHRQALLSAAGIEFEVVVPEIDERAVEAGLGREARGGELVATVLAQAKAADVSARFEDSLVIGADQTLALGDRLFHKPADMEEARRNLLALRGKTHQLHSAVCLAHKGEVVWEHLSTVDMTMRDFGPGFAGRYLARTGERALHSVGAYQIEAEGVQLFERIEGDHFAIIGLPMLPLLAELRKRNAIDG